MGNTTFSGPIRSTSTLKTVSKNSTTGTITEIITMGDAPVALGDEDKTLDNATHSGRVLAVPASVASLFASSEAKPADDIDVCVVSVPVPVAVAIDE